MIMILIVMIIIVKLVEYDDNFYCEFDMIIIVYFVEYDNDFAETS